MKKPNPVSVAAAELRTRGFALCKPDPKEKKPTYKGWSKKSLEAGAFGPADQIGIMGGPLSDGNRVGHSLIEVDLDSPEAVTLADAHLPNTGMADGRAGKPRSHRYYLVPNDSIPEWARSAAPDGSKAAQDQKGHPGPFKKAFDHRESGTRVIDFIGTGGQVVCPPAVWVSKDGTRTEPREWSGGTLGEPAVVPFLELWTATCELASAAGAGVPDVVPRPPRGRGTHVPVSEIGRVRKYLATCAPAVSGQNGHAALFWACRVVVYGFDLDPEQSFHLIATEYNPRCAPAWSDSELRHKIEDADRVPYKEPRGWLRDREREAPSHTRSGKAKSAGQVVGASAPAPGDKLSLKRLDTVKVRPVKYLVPGRIPKGKLILWAGRGGSGKSTASRALVAALTTGRCALGLSYPNPVTGKVLIVATEDGVDDTITPGLLAEGADLSRVAMLEGVERGDKKFPFTLLPEHVELLRAKLAASPDIRLVIIDPIASFVGRSKLDDHKASELRLVLDPLNELAEATGATVLLIAHLNKATGDAVDRIAGSAAYRDAVRAAFLVAEDPEDDTRRLLMPIKENLPGFDRTAIPFRLAELDDAQAREVLDRPQFAELLADDLAEVRDQLRRVKFEEPVTVNPNSATRPKKKTDPAQACAEFIVAFLGSHSWPESELAAACERAGHSANALWKAKRLLRKDDKADATRLSSRPRGSGGAWWVWIGGQQELKPARPERSEHTEETQQTQQTQRTEDQSTEFTEFAETTESAESTSLSRGGEWLRRRLIHGRRKLSALRADAAEEGVGALELERALAEMPNVLSVPGEDGTDWVQLLNEVA